MKNINSLELTKYRCQYYVVFAPKYGRQVIYREIKTNTRMYQKIIEKMNYQTR